MIDELDLLKNANPVPASAVVEPLPESVERHIVLLRGKRSFPRRSLLAAAAAGIAVVTTVALVGSGTTAPPATAAPTPLLVDRSVPVIPLAEVARRAGALAAGDPAVARAVTHNKEWAVAMETGPDGAAPVTVPWEVRTEWLADGSGWREVFEGDEPVRRKDFGPGGWEGESEFPRQPPVSDFRAYLGATRFPHVGSTTEVVDTLAAFLRTWTPAQRETAAIVEMLVAAGDLEAAGAVTDRVGRRGQAYTHADPNENVDVMVVLDPTTGRVLGIEQTFNRDFPEYRVEAGQLMSYQVYLG